jgi:pimeloyl-ACP methyl ester carboxylesterase
VGQSFGGHIAFLVAAWHPELVASLVVVEDDPDELEQREKERVSTWLGSWCRPFADREAALAFFGPEPSASVWVAGLERRPDGLWPRFDAHVLRDALRHVGARSWWDEWARITCPTWVVRGAAGALSLEEANKMADLLPDASVVTIAEAGHEVHVDQAEALAQVVRTAVDRSGR